MASQREVPGITENSGPTPARTPQETPEPATGQAPAPRRRGRRPAGTDTRADILASARRLFTEQGYDAVSLRAIARDAGVDPALVHHYFSGKGELFVASVVALGVDPGHQLDRISQVPHEQAGRELVLAFLGVWDGSGPQGAFVGILQIAMSPDEGIRPFREFLVAEILRRFPISTDDPAEGQRRAQLVASQVLGMAMTRYVLQLPAMAQATPAELADWIGPTLQRYLDGEAG